MKQIIIFSCVLILISCHSGQDRSDSIGTLPTFGMLRLDSSSVLYTKEIPAGKTILLMYFNPDCPHCQQETKMFISHMDLLRNVNFYLLSGAPLEDIANFNQRFQLDKYQNITVGKDFNHSFFRAFKPSSIPYLAIYNSDHKLIKVYKGVSELQTLLKAVNS